MLKCSLEMKKSTKIRGAIGIFVCVGLWVVYMTSTLSYSEVKAGCELAISADSSFRSLEVWLREHDIEYLKTYSVQTQTLEFETEVRGGLLSAHMVYGTFTFAKDGSHLDHTIHDIYYGIL